MADKKNPSSQSILDKVFAIREDLTPLSSVILGLIPVLILGLLWIIATSNPKVELRMIPVTILPGPREFLGAIPRLLSPQKALAMCIFMSLKRITLGFLIATAIALPLGVLMGSFTRVRATFTSLTVIGSYLPIPALVPLSFVWFDIGESQKIGFLTLACFVYLLPAFVNAISNVDDVFLNTAYTLGANKWHMVSKVLVPVALPDIYQVMRMGYGVGFTWIIMAEMINTQTGLGALMYISQQRGGDNAIVYLVLAVIVLLAFVIDRLWSVGYRAIFSYKEAR